MHILHGEVTTVEAIMALVIIKGMECFVNTTLLLIINSCSYQC